MNLSQSGGNYDTPKFFKKKKMNYLGYKPVKISNKSKVVDYKRLWESWSSKKLLERINHLRIKQDTLLTEISKDNIKNFTKIGEHIQELLEILERKNKRSKLKELFREILEEEKQIKESNFDIESFIASLNIEDPKLKKFIINRISSFDAIETKLNKLIPLLRNAKQETIQKYKKNPSFNILYSNDLAVDYLDDMIKMFK